MNKSLLILLDGFTIGDPWARQQVGTRGQWHIQLMGFLDVETILKVPSKKVPWPTGSLYSFTPHPRDSVNRDDRVALIQGRVLRFRVGSEVCLTRQDTTILFTCGVRQNVSLSENRKRRTWQKAPLSSRILWLYQPFMHIFSSFLWYAVDRNQLDYST